MKRTKKMLAMLLASLMVLSFSIAVAAEGEGAGTTGDENPQATYIVEMDGAKYTTLGDAVAKVPTDGTQKTITLLQNASGGGVKVQSGQNIVFDLNNCTYTVGAPTVGSTGTETLGFQLLKGSTVTMINGTIEASTVSSLRMMINNYCDLTLQNVTLDASKAPQCQYVSSNNNGTVKITGNTNILAAKGNTALDVYYWPSYNYQEVHVMVDTTGTIDGGITYGRDKSGTGEVAQNATLDIKNGTITGTISEYNLGMEKADIEITGGTFSSNQASKYVAPGNTLVVNEDGKYEIGIDEDKAVAEVNGKGYVTVDKAIEAAAQNGGTVTLLKDTAENVIIPKGANITLDIPEGITLKNTDGHTITNNGTLTITGKGTVDNVTHAKGALYNNVGATATLEGCTFTRSNEAGTSTTENGGNSWYVIKNFGTMTIKDGTTVKMDSGYSSLLGNGWQDYNKAKAGTNGEPVPTTEATLTIEGGIFDGGLNTIKNDDNSKLTINNGEFKNIKQHAVLNWNIAEINGGSFDTTGGNRAVVRSNKTEGVDFNKGELVITNGTFKAKANVPCIETNTTGSVKVSGGEFSSAVPEEYCADGFNPKDNGNGTYGVCNHANSTAVRKENVKEATCTAEGSYDEVTYCTKCGDVLSTEADKVIEKVAHTYEWRTDKEATHTEKGSRHQVCSVCGAKGETGEIPAKVNDHTPGTEWKSDEANHWKECACGAKLDSAAHTFKTVVDKAATATEKGSKHEECEICGYKKAAVEIPVVAPQTGDYANPTMWIAVMAVAMVGVVAMALLRGKKRYSHK